MCCSAWKASGRVHAGDWPALCIACRSQLTKPAQLAALLGVSYKKTKRLCVEQRWYADELPAPIEGVTPRRWRLSDVDAWLMSNERRSWT